MKVVIFRKFKRAGFSAIEDVFLFISAATIFIIMLLDSANVIGRYLFNYPVKGTIEIAGLGLVLIIFFSISSVHRTGQHIGMDTVLDLLRRKKPAFYHGLQSFNALLFLIVVALIGYFLFPAALESRVMHQQTEGPLYVMVWPFKLCIVVGCAIICVRSVILLIRHLRATGSASRRLQVQEEQ